MKGEGLKELQRREGGEEANSSPGIFGSVDQFASWNDGNA